MPRRTAQGISPSQLRPSSRINSRLDKNLLAYVAAAGATGVSLLASSPAAEAKIVYTPANTRLYDNSFPVDLNNDGIADINLIASFPVFSFYRTILRVSPAAGNGVVAVAAGAADLPWGARVGSKAAFDAAPQLMASRFHQRSYYYYNGPWAGTRIGYLDIKFSINGETHYGWARLTVGRLPATLTGYAYETIPNKPIPAGRTSGPVSASAAESAELASSTASANLGLLARGADGIAIWRRDEEAVST